MCFYDVTCHAIRVHLNRAEVADVNRSPNRALRVKGQNNILVVGYLGGAPYPKSEGSDSWVRMT
jgi:hypothetical protein